DPVGYQPYMRDPQTLARPWVLPGTPGMEHRIGGLAKQDGTGRVSYDPEDHEHMVRQRAAKVERVADAIPDLEVDGPQTGDLLVVGWGSTYGALRTATEQVRATGAAVAHAHLRHLKPFPRNLGEVLTRYRQVLVPELNLGQLALLLQARFPVRVVPHGKVKGQPFRIREIAERIRSLLGSRGSRPRATGPSAGETT
ncbi:MAG: 2-oxoglutarate ferredoxin oxidoreductase subunit alpha, partial [Gemmatimonadota bacterium]